VTPVRHTVVIGTYNRPDALRRCLVSLVAARQPDASWEILVMDNGDEAFSRRNAAVVRGLQDTRVRHVRMSSVGLMAARHEGAEAARGELVSFVDEDVLVEASWFEGVRDAMLDDAVELVTGPILPLYEAPPPPWLESLWVGSEAGRHTGYLAMLDLGAEPRRIVPTLVFGANYSFRRATFFRVGGSHPDAFPRHRELYQGNGETALSIRIGAASGHAVYEPRCGVRHIVPPSRLTVTYLEEKARGFGVEASYTELRRDHGLGPQDGVAPLCDLVDARSRGGARKRRDTAPRGSAGEPDDASRGVAGAPRDRAVPAGLMSLTHALHDARREGFAAHRAAALAEPALMEWILRPDYLGANGELPPPGGESPQPSLDSSAGGA